MTISEDLARVEDEEEEINAAIRERSAAEHEDVDRFTQQKAKVEGELEELRQAVALKEQELAQLQVRDSPLNCRQQSHRHMFVYRIC